MRPDILEKRMAALNEQGHRRDVRVMGERDEKNVVKDILKEQRVLKDGKTTIVYD